MTSTHHNTSERFSASLTEDGRYRLLVEAVTDYAIYMLDKEGIVSSWNAGAQRFTGYEATEIIGKHFSQFYTEEDQANGLPQRGLDIAAREGKFEGEGWRIRKDGTRFWTHVVIDPIRDSDGTLVGYAKITRDLTERRDAKDSLRHTEEQFKLLVESVTDYAIFMLTPDGHVATWNKGAQRIKGYLPEDIIGRHFSEFYTSEDREAGAPADSLAAAARVGRYEKEGWRVRKDGTKFLANVVIDAIRSADGNLLGFAKITRDVTQRKQAERELEVAREAFFQSQKLDAIGQLTGGVAHDFNNLLAAILGSLELLRRRLPSDPKSFRLIDNALEGARRGALLTQRMLSFARRQDLKPTPVYVPDLIEGMIGLLRSSLGPSIMINTRFGRGLGHVLADPNQLELSVLNLAVNARDAMPEGGLIIIEAREELGLIGNQDARCLCLSVKDNGEGMDEDTLAHADEPFFTTKGVGKGTGLGLSMVQGMAQQLGGKLQLRSMKGEGTLAEIYLPIAADSDTAGNPKQESPTEIPASPKLVVLAVDDDSLVLLNTTAMLEDLGHKVFEASRGHKALEILEREKGIDLVITDQAMPGMTGLQLAEAIRERRPTLPVIIATGYAELPAALDQIFIKLPKPFFQHDLTSAIVSAIEGIGNSKRN